MVRNKNKGRLRLEGKDVASFHASQLGTPVETYSAQVMNVLSDMPLTTRMSLVILPDIFVSVFYCLF